MATTTTVTSKVQAPSDAKVVNTTLNYYLDPSKGGHTSYQIGVSDYYRRKFDPHVAQIYDIRGLEQEFTLATHGFQHAKSVSEEKDFNDDEQVKATVYPEVEQLLKDATGATKVHVFSHIIRKDSREAAEKAVREDASLKEGDTPFQPVVPARFIHVDFSEDGSAQILKDNFPLANELSKTRWGIINVWRAIKPIMKDPLTLCDARSARDEDLMPVTSYLPPKGSGGYASVSAGDGFELYYKRYREGEKWYYADRMEPNEVWMLKIFDSIKDGKTARRCPHSAFSDPSTVGSATRESIEVRALVFWEDQPL